MCVFGSSIMRQMDCCCCRNNTTDKSRGLDREDLLLRRRTRAAAAVAVATTTTTTLFVKDPPDVSLDVVAVLLSSSWGSSVAAATKVCVVQAQEVGVARKYDQRAHNNTATISKYTANDGIIAAALMEVRRALIQSASKFYHLLILDTCPLCVHTLCNPSFDFLGRSRF